MASRARGRILRIGTLVAGNFGTALGGVVGAVLVSRMLGPEGKGVVAMLLLVGMLVGMLADFGLSAAGVFLLRQDPSCRDSLLTLLAAWTLSAGVAAVGVGIGVLLLTLGQHPPLISVVGGALTLPALGNSLFRQVLLAEGRHHRYNVSVLVEAWMPPVMLAVASAAGSTPSLEATGAFYLVGWASAVCVAVVGLRWTPRWWEGGLARRAFAYGVRAQAGTVLQYVNYRLDVFLVNALAGTRTLGIYSVAFNVAEVLLRLPRLVAMLLFPQVAGSAPQRGVELTVLVFRTTLVGNLVATVLLAVSAWVLVPVLFGPDFAAARVPVLVLGPGLVAASWQLLLVEHLKGQGLPQAKAKVALVGVALTVVLGPWLIGALGAVGAAAASTFAYTAAAIYAVREFCRLTGVSARALFSPAKGDMARLLRGAIK